MDTLLNKEGFVLEEMTAVSGISFILKQSRKKSILKCSGSASDASRKRTQNRSGGSQKTHCFSRVESYKADELQKSSLNALLIQQQFIEKWDGKTPIYGNAPAFFKNVN